MAAGPSQTPLSEHLGITAQMRVALLHAPEGFDDALGSLPADVEVQHGLRKSERVDLIVGFVTERAHLERNIDWLLATLPRTGAFWVVWPAEASTEATDVDEEVVREVAMARGWVVEGSVAIGAPWTGSKIVRRGSLHRT